MPVPKERVAVKAERTGSRVFDKVQANASESLRAMNNNPFIHGAMATDPSTGSDLISFVKSDEKTLNHNLGRKPTGVMLVHCESPERFDAEPDNTNPPGEGGLISSDSRTMIYVMPSSCKARLWVW